MFRKRNPKSRSLPLPTLILSVVGWLTAAHLAGCSTGGNTAPDPWVDGPVELSRCRSCEELESRLKQSASRLLTNRFAIDRGCFRFMDDIALMEPTPSEADAGQEFSVTNVQESGVDEADFVKNDGQYIYILSGSYFLIYTAKPADQVAEVSRIEVEGTPSEMFVSENKAVIFSTFWWPVAFEEALWENPYDGYQLKVTVLDLADKNNVQVLRELYFEGNYRSARLVDGVVHAVLYTGMNIPVVDTSSTLGANQTRIDKASLASWIPKWAERSATPAGGDLISEQQLPCTSFYLPNSPEIYSLLIVASLDLRNPHEGPNIASIISSTDITYASPSNIYVSHWTTSGEDCIGRTGIHKFDIQSTRGRAIYRASGTVQGNVLNQFSMGEKDGYLRVATTQDPSWGSPGADTVSSNLFVLNENEGNLEVVGEVRNIAPTERIYAARFVGDLGFMVTRVQIDPLFTFDLSAPRNPQLVGQLEVPGYSTYIHPVGDDHLLTIGKDVQGDEGFSWFLGVQISVYNISDLANPALVDMEIIGDRGTASEALNNHKAYNYFAPADLLAFPIEIRETSLPAPQYGTLTFQGFQVYRVDLAQGYSLMGQIDHNELYGEGTDCSYAQMRRTLVIDNALFTISSAGMKVNDLDDLSSELGLVRFPDCGNADGNPWPVMEASSLFDQ